MADYPEEKEAREQVLKAGLELVRKGLIVRTWGNISARISETEFIITPSGRDYRDLTPDDLVKTDIYGEHEPGKKPSSEFKVHAEVYINRPDINFVIHTHQVFATCISIMGKSIPFGPHIPESVKDILGPKLICARYGMNGSDRLKYAVGAAIGENPECNQVLMKDHGALCMGADYDAAFRVAFVLEDVCRKIYEKYTDAAIMKEPDLISPVEIPEYEDFYTEKKEPDTEGVILHVDTPYIHKLSMYGDSVRAYIDDCAQIAGPNIKCASPDMSFDEIMDKMGWDCAIFIKEDGAYCYGTDEDEARAVGTVLEKNCMAAYLAYIRGCRPVALLSAYKDRSVYVNKYSKLKKENADVH